MQGYHTKTEDTGSLDYNSIWMTLIIVYYYYYGTVLYCNVCMYVWSSHIAEYGSTG